MTPDVCDVCGALYTGDGPPWTCADCIADAMTADADACGTLADVADGLRSVAPFVPARWIVRNSERGNV